MIRLLQLYPCTHNQIFSAEFKPSWNPLTYTYDSPSYDTDMVNIGVTIYQLHQ